MKNFEELLPGEKIYYVAPYGSFNASHVQILYVTEQNIQSIAFNSEPVNSHLNRQLMSKHHFKGKSSVYFDGSFFSVSESMADNVAQQNSKKHFMQKCDTVESELKNNITDLTKIMSWRSEVDYFLLKLNSMQKFIEKQIKTYE